MTENRKFLTRVTVTGADDSTNISQLIQVNKKYPFVEWGILLSSSNMGSFRFPSIDWMNKLWAVKYCDTGGGFALKDNLRLSGHLCGRWVRDFCLGKGPTFMDDLGTIINMFDRIQLNFHNIAHRVDVDALAKSLEEFAGIEFILQLDGVNDNLLDKLKQKGCNVSGLYDLSGGAGVLPMKWMDSYGGHGYAGGLSPENVVEQIQNISNVCKADTWIDAETRLRFPDDSALDWDKVEEYLKLSQPFVK